jgi:hypothetical protein
MSLLKASFVSITKIKPYHVTSKKKAISKEAPLTTILAKSTNNGNFVIYIFSA